MKEVFKLEEGHRKIVNNMPVVKLPLSQTSLKDVVAILFEMLHDNAWYGSSLHHWYSSLFLPASMLGSFRAQ